jgi:hypothetical protein
LRSLLSHAARLRAGRGKGARHADDRGDIVGVAKCDLGSMPAGLVTIIRYWASYPVQTLCTAKPVPLKRCLSEAVLKYEHV